MKRIKKLASLVLAMVMVLSMGLTVSATGATAPTDSTPVGNTQAGNGNFTITINDTTKDYVYTAYQIFSGDLSKAADGTKTLSNIVWGSGVDTTKAAAAFPNQTAAEVAANLNEKGFDAEEAQAFAAKIATCLSSTATNSTPVADTTNADQIVGYTIGSLTAGYYLVLNSAVPTTDGSYTRYMMEVVGDVTASPKSDVPTVEKKVKDVNDSTGSTSGWQDYADFDLNDSINYQIRGTLPANYADYEKYTYKFTDTMSAGLTLTPGSVKVYAVNGEDVDVAANRTDITAQASISPVANQVFTVEIPDVKKLSGVIITSATKIVVEYTCTLNENAVTTSVGNENKVKLEYSNDPNHTGTGTPPTGTTPEDVVVVFTFELNTTKVTTVNGVGQPLSGAEFTLEKYSKASENAEGNWSVVNANVAGTGDGKNVFAFNKLDAGIYKLTESKTPAGYNTIEPIYFMVEATYKVDSTTNQNVVDTLTIKGVSETVENPDYTSSESYTETISGQNGSFNATVTSGKIATDVDNQKGSLLPSTGGIGTTIFYVVGGILVVVAGILLVTKKRMSAR